MRLRPRRLLTSFCFHALSRYNSSVFSIHSIARLGYQAWPFQKWAPIWNICSVVGAGPIFSNEDSDFRAVARLVTPPDAKENKAADDEVRNAFHSGVVILGSVSDLIYKGKGLKAFIECECENTETPMQSGPAGQFLDELFKLRETRLYSLGVSKVRIGIVTAGSATHARWLSFFRHTLNQKSALETQFLDFKVSFP